MTSRHILFLMWLLSNSQNGMPFTGKLETLSEFSLDNDITVALRDDIADTLDRAAGAQFTGGDLVAVATSSASTVITSNGAATATASADMSDSTVRDIVDDMKKKFVPKLGNGMDYGCVGSVNALRGLYDKLQALMQYANPEFLYNNEKGRYYGVRFN